MGAITQPRCQVMGLPVKIPDSDGAPARVIAIEDEA
jgi:kynurenine formamidase